MANITYWWNDPETNSPNSASMASQVLTGVSVGDNADAMSSARLKVWLAMEAVWQDLPLSTGERANLARMGRMSEQWERSKDYDEGEIEFESDYGNFDGPVTMHWDAHWKNDGSECELNAEFTFRGFIGAPGHTDQSLCTLRTTWASEMPGITPNNVRREVKALADGLFRDSCPSPEEMQHADPERWFADHPGAYS
ncbi:hypothetical protein ACR56Q_01310 [Corynebacterium glyciniphilum]